VNDHLALARRLTAAHFGIAESDVSRRHIRQARKAGVPVPPERKCRPSRPPTVRGPDLGMPEGYEAVQISTDGTDIRSVRARPTPDEAEEIPEGWLRDRISRLTRGDGGLIQQWDIYRPAKDGGRDDLVARVMADFDGQVPRAAAVPAPEGLPDDRLTVYPLGDPHLGLRGADGYGLQEGARLLREAVADLVRRGAPSKECLILNLGDYYHSDDPRNRTRRHGFDLDVDGDWFEILKVGRDTFLSLINEALEHHEIVNVKCLIGNHDDLSSLFLTLLVDAHYRDEPRVRVDVSGAPFQWFEWGKNLFGFTHGQDAKPDKLPAKMANAQREAWGRTLHRYWLVGHVHHVRRVEIGGVMIESFRTLASRDGYHESHGYLAGRDLTRIVYHREHGEISRETVSAHMLLRDPCESS